MSSTAKRPSLRSVGTVSKTPRVVEPRHLFDSLRHQVDRLFEDFSSSPLHLPFARHSFEVESFWQRELLGSGIPAVDITEKDQSFEITAELPGMDEKNIDITLTNGNLVLKGEKKEESEGQQKGYYLTERHYGSFERIFSLPKGVDPEQIAAHFSKGVLTISLPKKPEACKPEKVIPVKTR